MRNERPAIAVQKATAEEKILKPAPWRCKPHGCAPVSFSLRVHLLRRERRLAWRAEQKIAADEAAAPGGTEESAALLESLLLKDIIAWSQGLTAAQRKYLMTLDPTIRTGDVI